jgi:hypothetical protein
MIEIIIVNATFDDDAAARWTATSSDVAGLHLTADTWAQLVERLPGAVHERLDRSPGSRRRELSIEIVLHASLNVTVGAPAKYHVGHSTGPARTELGGFSTPTDVALGSVHSPARSCGQVRLSH